MSECKKYYWLKLKEDFFQEDTIQWLEEQNNGKEYCLFYLKLCLKSLKTNGLLVRNVGQIIIPYDVNKLAEITHTSLDTAIVAMEVFKKIGLIEILDNGEIYMTQLANMVGSESKWAQKKRKQREKLKEGDNVPQLSQNCPRELEKEIRERDKDKELKIDIKKIISAWNSLGVNRIISIKNNRLKSLKARIEVYSEEDLFRAIENIKKSKFLKGENDRNWIISFDWFIAPNNFPKVLEGNYTDRKTTGAVLSKNEPKPLRFNNFEPREYYNDQKKMQDLENKLLGWDKEGGENEE